VTRQSIYLDKNNDVKKLMSILVTLLAVIMPTVEWSSMEELKGLVHAVPLCISQKQLSGLTKTNLNKSTQASLHATCEGHRQGAFQ
jgi:hypothetical protein